MFTYSIVHITFKRALLYEVCDYRRIARGRNKCFQISVDGLLFYFRGWLYKMCTIPFNKHILLLMYINVIGEPNANNLPIQRMPMDARF